MRKVVIAFAVAALGACTTDSYDTGTGELSLMRADFVEAHSTEGNVVDYVVTDDGDRLSLSPRPSAEWIEKADTIYRAVMYYNRKGSGEAEPIVLSPVPVLVPVPAEKHDSISTDPVRFESMWTSADGKYINMGIYLKVGKVDGDAELHTIGIIDDGAVFNPDGTKTARLRLYHDQGDVPEYYSSKYYVSIPCGRIAADSVIVTVNTYDGTVKWRTRIP